MRNTGGFQMTALEHEITATQIALFQRTGKLLEIAEEVKREREELLRLLKERAGKSQPTRLSADPAQQGGVQ